MHSRRARDTKRNQARLKKFILHCERLEPRQLLASDLNLEVLQNKGQDVSQSEKALAAMEDQLAVLAPTHSYTVDGQPVAMVVHPAKLAIKPTLGTDKDDLLNIGLQFERKLDNNFSVYTAVDGQAIDTNQLLTTGLVQEAVSVFFTQQSRSEAVLLNELIVALKPGVSAANYFANNPNFTSYQPLLGTPDQFVATVAAGKGPVALNVLNQIDDDPQVAFASPNFYQDWQKFFTPNDPRFTNQWHLHNTGQAGGLVDADVDMPEAWDVIAGNSATFKIGVIDDSVASHPDLNLWTNPGESADGIDNDGNGWVDDLNGWNFVGNNNSSGPTTADDVHGTAVAGVAAAKGNNSLGVAGAGYNASVISARIFEGASVASDANIAGALYYMAGRTANGLGTWASADVVNNSWGGGANSAAINAALTWGTTNGRTGRGTPYLFATGNGFGAVSQPALQSLNIPGVFAIGATNNKGTRSDYSNFGPAVDLVTPSNDTRPGYLAIDTTDRVGADGYDPSDYTGTGANGFGGTSSATPLATGITSLVMARADALGIVLTPAQLRDYMRTQTDYLASATFDINTGKNLEYGYGRLNASSAVSNLGQTELSVLSATKELSAGDTVSIGSAYLDEFLESTVRIRNQGTLPLNLSSLNISGGAFTISSGFGLSTLALGQATTFKVRFTPTAGGLASGTVTIGSNDSNEGSFTFTVSAIGIAPNVSGIVFEDADGDGQKDSFDPLVPGTVVYADVNGNSTLDTVSNTFTSNVSVPLVDGGIAQSTLAVSGLITNIFDVNVKVNITHTFDSDLIITAISPSGVRVQLANGNGGNGDNFTNTIFDDEANLAIGSGVAPFTGSFRPVQSLSAFDAQFGNGTWTLEIVDTAALDTGTLLSWELTIVTSEPFATARANGNYGILDLPVGTYDVRALPGPGWSNPTTYNVNITAPTDILKGRDFAIARNNRFYSFVFDDVDADGIWDAGEAPATGREFLDDANSNGVRDLSAPTTFNNSTPLPLPDLVTRTSTLNVAGMTGAVTDVNVRVNITHTFDADLDVFLIAPDGTRVELFTDVGGGGANFTNTILDEQAGTAITAGAAPFTGSFRPEGLLSRLNGKVPNGTWTLEISDDAGGDTGTLNSWDVIIVSGEVTTPIPNTGLLNLDMPPGTHNMLLSAQAGWRYTIPSNGVHTVTPAGVPIFDQRYGTRLNNVAPTVDVANASVTAAEGTTLTNSGTWTDPNPTDIVVFSASVGTITSNATSWSWSLPTTDDAGSTTVTITANDGEGGITTKTFTYTVTNVNPTVAATSSTVSGDVLTSITNTGTWGDSAADTVSLTASSGTIVKNANGTWSWSISPTSVILNQSVTITATDEDGGSASTSFSYSAFAFIPTTRAYYAGSFYANGGNVAGGLDTSKSLIKAGAASSSTNFANVTNYSKGINGVVLDVTGLTATSLTGADFTFKMSPQGAFNEAANPPSSWTNAPAPTSISLTPGTPGPNSSRVKIEWADNAIQDRWLQIRVLPNANTGLAAAATYYLGNLRGDIDGVLVGGLFVLQNADLQSALPVGGVGTVTTLRDVDKNGFVLNSDFLIIRNGINAGLSLRAITIPAAGSAQEASTIVKPDTGLLTRGLAPRISSQASALSSFGQTLVTSDVPSVTASTTSSLLVSASAKSATSSSVTLAASDSASAPSVISRSTKKAQAVDAVFEQLGSQL